MYFCHLCNTRSEFAYICAPCCDELGVDSQTGGVVITALGDREDFRPRHRSTDPSLGVTLDQLRIADNGL